MPSIGVFLELSEDGRRLLLLRGRKKQPALALTLLRFSKQGPERGEGAMPLFFVLLTWAPAPVKKT